MKNVNPLSASLVLSKSAELVTDTKFFFTYVTPEGAFIAAKLEESKLNLLKTVVSNVAKNPILGDFSFILDSPLQQGDFFCFWGAPSEDGVRPLWHAGLGTFLIGIKNGECRCELVEMNKNLISHVRLEEIHMIRIFQKGTEFYRLQDSTITEGPEWE